MSSIVIKSLLSAAFVLTSLMPATALPSMPLAAAVEQPAAQRAGVIEVRQRHRKRFRRHHQRRHYNRHKPRHHERRHHERRGHLSRSHVDYCYNRYRSYRAYDNTYQPYHGRRRACRSPY